MLHVNTNAENTAKIMLETYHLPLDDTGKINNIFELAQYVFEKCRHLIPNVIQDFFAPGQKIAALTKPDLIRHLIINAYMVQLIESDGMIHTSGAFFNRMYKTLDYAISNEKNVWHLFGGKDVPRVAQEYFKKMSERWMNPDLDAKSNALPAFAAPLFAFQAIHVDSHKVLKGYGESHHHNWSYLKQHKEVAKKLHLHFCDNFYFLLKQYPNVDKIHRLYEKDQMSYHPVLNRILFEREYQLGLTNKIAILTMNETKEVKLHYYRLLSALALLPNINGRLLYLPYTRASEKIEELGSAFIGMALITIPVMESYFLNLLKRKGFSLNSTAMNKFMHEYGEDFFIDIRSQPEPIPGIRNQIFPVNLGLQWELAELPFESIGDIQLILNKVAEIQRSHLNDVYLDPYVFLGNHGYDKYKILLFKKNVNQMIEALSHVVKEKYFDVLSVP